MRVLIIAAAAILLGALAGFGRTWLDYALIEDKFEDNVAKREEVPKRDAAGGPELAVDDADLHTFGYRYNFGVMDRKATNKRTFVFRNKGDQPLSVELIETTCKCTTPSLQPGQIMTIAPGKSAEVSLEWTPEDYATGFRQTAIFKTNDSQWPEFRLIIEGQVLQTVVLSSQVFPLADVPADESRSFELHMYGLKDEPLELLEHRLLNAAREDDFEVAIQKFTAKELQENERAKSAGAKSGFRIKVATKTGLQLGPIQQTLLLRTNLQDDGIEIPIQGTIVGDVNIRTTAPFNRTSNTLMLGLSKPGEKSKATLQLFVQGPHKDSFDFSIAEIDPAESLSVTTGTIQDLETVKIIPLTIEVKPDSPEIVRLGPTLEEHGRIVIKTTHPSLAELIVYVEFAVGQ